MTAYEEWLQARLAKMRAERDALQAELAYAQSGQYVGEVLTMRTQLATRYEELATLKALNDADEKLINALSARLTKQAAVIEALRKDLVKMLPKSSDTMSAMRQRDITNFVLSRLDTLNEGRSE